MFSLDDRLSLSEFTARERQVLELVADGLSAKRIAQEIGIAPRTVERHIENVRNKLRAKNKTHMIAKAMAFGLIEIDRRILSAKAASAAAAFRFEPKIVSNE
jgi:LuxR family transcriptional regulator of spore coat protein